MSITARRPPVFLETAGGGWSPPGFGLNNGTTLRTSAAFG